MKCDCCKEEIKKDGKVFNDVGTMNWDLTEFNTLSTVCESCYYKLKQNNRDWHTFGADRMLFRRKVVALFPDPEANKGMVTCQLVDIKDTIEDADLTPNGMFRTHKKNLEKIGEIL